MNDKRAGLFEDELDVSGFAPKPPARAEQVGGLDGAIRNARALGAEMVALLRQAAQQPKTEAAA